MDKEALFQDNLERFAKMCPLAAIHVQDVDVKPLQFCLTKKGELNLKRSEGGQETYYHSQKGAVVEAEAWVEETCPLGVSVIFLYGLGLGYYYEALKEWLRRDPGRFLIVLEDDLAVVRLFLETEQAARFFKDTQVVLKYFPTPGEYDWGKFREQFEWCFYGFGGKSYRFAALRLYSQERAVTYNLVRSQFEINLKEIRAEQIEIFNSQELLFRNFYSNFLWLPKSGFAPNLFGHFSHVPALICGAGPSIGKQLPLVRELEDRALIFGAGSGLNVLNRHGIQPHFAAAVDPTEAQESRLMTNTAYELPYFCTNRFYAKAFELIHGPRLYLPGFARFAISQWFYQELELPHPYVGGNISTSSVCGGIAAVLGNNPVILIGMDMAYTESVRYASGVTAHPTSDREQHKALHSISDKAIPAFNVDGASVMTKWDWVLEAASYTTLSREYPQFNIINATEGGLKILEVPHLPFSEVAKKYLTHAYDLRNWVHAEIQQINLASITDEKVLAVMEKWVLSLERSLEHITQLQDELERYPFPSGEEERMPTEVMTGKMALLQEELKDEPAYKYFLEHFNKVFELSSSPNLLKLRFFSDQFKGKQRLEVLHQFEKTRYRYFHQFVTLHLDTIREVIQHHKQKQERLIEYAVAPHHLDLSALSKQDTYSFDEGKLIICDEELGIAYEGEFQPRRLSKERKEAHQKNKGFLTEEPNVWEGEALLFYPDGTVKGQLFYQRGQRHGPSTFYSQEGKELAKSWFWEDRRVGKTWQYYATGQVYSLLRYRNGSMHGRQEYYYLDGAIKTVMHFQDGLLEGEVRLYHPNSRLKRELRFVQGLLHGEEKFFDEKGMMMVEAEYKSGLPVGRSRAWHANGRLAKEIIFYDNPLNFDLYLWDESGKLIKKQLSLPEKPLEGMIGKSKELRDSLEKVKEEFRNLSQ